jgi:hypothetical protein
LVAKINTSRLDAALIADFDPVLSPRLCASAVKSGQRSQRSA